MSYLRPLKLQPARLEVAASLSWTKYVLSLLRQHRHFFNDHVCLRALRQVLGDHLAIHTPHVLEEELFHRGLALLNREVWQQGDSLTPDMFVLYMFVFYKPDMKQLEVPSLSRHTDRVTVLDLLYNLGTPHGHQLTQAKIKMFDRPEISIEESYLTKRVLRGFMHLRSLVLWKAADDAMLQILGLTCRSLESIDLWKSVSVTDLGIRHFLGLDAQTNTKLCKTLNTVMIRDTGVTDEGAYSLLLHSPRLETLEFSHGSFIKQFLDRIEESYVRTHRTFPLRSMFLPVLSEEAMYNVVCSFPQLEELSLWTSLRHLPTLKQSDLARVRSLKVGGLSHPSILTELHAVIGPQLSTLKIETVHFDINVEVLGAECPGLEELSIINARVGLTPATEKQTYPPVALFPRLTKLYFFLVHYIPSPVPSTPRPPHSVAAPSALPLPATGYTALHTILAHASCLETVQVTGTPALTDSCLEQILATNPLLHLRRLVISNPSSGDSPVVVPLTGRSVILLHRRCPSLQCVGDLRHWAVSPAQRSSLARQVAGQPPVQQSVWTKVRIPSSCAARPRHTSVLLQTAALALN